MNEQRAKTNRTQSEPRSKTANLDGQYRNIGISAVAAALPYVGRGKDPATTPSDEQNDQRSEYRTRSVLAV